MKKIDFGVSIITLLIGIYVNLSSNQFRGEAAYFPKLISGCLIVASIVLLILALIKKDVGIKPEFSKYKKVLGLIIALIIYAVAIPRLGYIISSAVMFGFCAYFLGEKRIHIIIITDIVATAAIYFVFHYLLKVPLPIGFFGF